MKAARNKIAEEAKQRDCTQRMETQLMSVNDSVLDFINTLYDIQTHTARKPLSKVHSIIVEGQKKMFVLNFELHKVIMRPLNVSMAGDDDLNHLPKALYETLGNLEEIQDSEKLSNDLVVECDKERGVENDN